MRSTQLLRELEARCERGEVLDCYSAAAVLELGAPDVEKQPERSKKLRERGNQLTLDACLAHDADAAACKRIVLSAKLAAVGTEDEAERRQLATAIVNAGTRGCHAGDLDVCIDVAAIFHKGEAGIVDDGRARELVSYACARDHQPACIELALGLAHRPSDARDRDRAEDLLDGACRKASALGCELLATLRLSGGAGAAVGAREAARRSCELGGAGGCAVFGHTLLDGIGGAPDPVAARAAFETACRGKDPRGCQMIEALR